MSEKAISKLTLRLGLLSFTIGCVMRLSCGESEFTGTLMVGGLIIMSISLFNLIIKK